MDYNTEFQSNNTDLQAILETINNLPEAGSSGDKYVQGSISLSSAGVSSISISGLDFDSIKSFSFVSDGSLSATSIIAFIYYDGSFFASTVTKSGNAYYPGSGKVSSLSFTYDSGTLTITISSTSKFYGQCYYLIIGE